MYNSQGAVDTGARDLISALRVKKDPYYDKKSGMEKEQWFESLRTSRTLYVGNLSFFTSEEQLLFFFGRMGAMKRVIMGLNRFKKSPCGFCFVEYHTVDDADAAQGCYDGSVVDDRIIRVDKDVGFVE